MEHYLIKKNPQSCGHCLQMKVENPHIKLHCETEKGCPIGDIAPSNEAASLVREFCEARAHDQTFNTSSMHERFVEKWELENEPELLISFASIWAQSMQNSREKTSKDGMKGKK